MIDILKFKPQKSGTYMILPDGHKAEMERATWDKDKQEFTQLGSVVNVRFWTYQEDD